MNETNILIVDDLPENLAILTSMLSDQGYIVRPAISGPVALKTIRKAIPDMILLDIMMPGMDGYEVCRRVKADSRSRDIPVIFMSALSETMDKIKAFEIGAVDYITKPFEIKEVLARVETHLSLRKMQQQLQAQNQQLHEEIIERKHAEKLLRESEERYRRLVEVSPDVIAVHRRGELIFLNAAGIKLLGANASDDLIGKSLLDFVHPDYHEAVKKRVRTGYENDEAVGLAEEQFLSIDGRIIDVEVAAAPILYQGEPATIVVVRDITARKQAEELLRKLEKAVETTEVGVTITDNDGQIVYINPADADMHGYTVEELLGQRSRVFAPPRSQENLNSASPHVNVLRHWKRERLNIRKDGSAFPVMLISNSIEDAKGNQIGRVVICEDITERKQAEADLLNAHKELQEKNSQLQELNASKDKFFSIISHDLRSPFATLIGFAELLQANFERYTHNDVKRYIDRIHTSAERLYALLENLLTWSRVQRGAMEYTPQPIDLLRLVEENFALCAGKAEQKQVTLKHFVRDGMIAYADLAMIDTVVRNLMSNALKFTPLHGMIVVSAQENGNTIELAVSDTGVGIAAEDLSKLFRIDIQYTNPGTAGEKGTGLGLVLCHDLVERNLGKIWVESALDKGTTFRFTLPQGQIETQNDADS